MRVCDEILKLNLNPKESMIQGLLLIMDGLNGGNVEDVREEIFDVLQREHRTLQQKFWKFIFTLMNNYAERAGADERNECSKASCERACYALREEDVEVWKELLHNMREVEEFIKKSKAQHKPVGFSLREEQVVRRFAQEEGKALMKDYREGAKTSHRVFMPYI